MIVARLASPSVRSSTVADPCDALASGDTADICAEFVRARVTLQEHIRALSEAHDQGLALDMAIAAEQLEAAAVALSANVRVVVARKNRMESLVQTVQYERRALQETVTDLFEACLRGSPPQSSAAWPDTLSPVDSYLWLRRCLEHHAVLIKRTLTLPDE